MSSSISNTRKMKISLKSFDYGLLEETVNGIVLAAKKTGSRIIGPIPLPNQVCGFIVNRSPHVNKKSREQFATITHKRLLYIDCSNPQIMDVLRGLDLPAGVDIQLD